MTTSTRIATLGHFLKATPLLQEQLFTSPQFQLCWHAFNTSEALNKLELMTPHLLLMVDQLPDATLPEACEVIRAWANELPIVVINTGRHQHYTQELYNIGVSHYFWLSELNTRLPLIMNELLFLCSDYKKRQANGPNEYTLTRQRQRLLQQGELWTNYASPEQTSEPVPVPIRRS